MRIVELNTVDYGSTGKIMLSIAETARAKGHEVWTFSVATRKKTSSRDYHEYYSSFCEYSVHYILGKMTGLNGYFSILSTLRLIRRFKEINPDVIHLHNLHGFNVNLPILFRYLKNANINVVWTLHDCWAFTGKCPYFTLVKCEKWIRGCSSCPQVSSYPESCVDTTRFMWKKKMEWFTGIKTMMVVTPSHWLADLAKQSYLRDYSIKQIPNGVDLSIFKPVSSQFRRTYRLEEKKVLLGVAFDWGRRKGLDVFIELAKRLDDTFRIVLVGTNESIDSRLPKDIISIHKTENQQQLAEIYSAADLFVNPTREENYPTVNMEAIACGTPVLTFRTGGSPEMLTSSTGTVVDCDDIDSMEREICRICETRPFRREDCVKAAQAFDMQSRFEEYVKLYEDCSYRT